MDIGVSLVWAVPVRAELAGAGLEAYVMSKPFVSTSKLCVVYGQNNGAPVGSLPLEIVNRTCSMIHGSILRLRQARWSCIQKCLEGTCQMEDHFENECELSKARGALEDHNSDDKFEDFILDNILHGITARSHLGSLDAPSKKSKSLFPRCREVRSPTSLGRFRC